MNDAFRRMVEELPGLLGRLIDSPARTRSNLRGLPPKGVYVFYEDRRAIYVGRSNRMKQRILEHGRNSSGQNSAPFAFNLAKERAREKSIALSKARKDLERDPTFARLFSKAKERVSQMSVRAIEIDDPVTQTIFEVYASIELNTQYNDFDTH